jgi:hypothetical protein
MTRATARSREKPPDHDSTPIVDADRLVLERAPEISKRMRRRVEGVLSVRDQRDQRAQSLGYIGRPFVLCGLPFKKPKAGTSYYRRQNGDNVLEITGSPKYGLPFGMDLQVLVWVTTLAARAKAKDGTVPRVLEFSSGAEFLNAFGLQPDGKNYQRARRRFMRVFYATWFFSKNNQRDEDEAQRVNFFNRIHLWFSRDIHAPLLPSKEFRNSIELSDIFREDLEHHLPPVDLTAIATWSDKPTVAYFYTWLCWRCYTARGPVEIPLTGPSGLKAQCGFDGYEGERGPRRFRQKITELLNHVREAWKECPVDLVHDDPVLGDYLLIKHRAAAIHQRRS